MVYRLKKQLRVYRIADARRPIFDGAGAALLGGRWHSAGRRLIYAAETFAGAILEKLAHTSIGRIPKHQAYIEIMIPAGTRVEALAGDELPNWDAEDQLASREYGDRWYDEGRTLVLLVPSIVTRVERNVLIHQEHPEFNRLTATEPREVLWDRRLFRGGGVK